MQLRVALTRQESDTHTNTAHNERALDKSVQGAFVVTG
jgi:hypothetical protein